MTIDDIPARVLCRGHDALSDSLALQTALDNATYELNAALTAVDIAEQKQAAAEAEVERLRKELSAERMSHLSHLGQDGEELARLRDQLMSMQKVHHDLFVAYEARGLELNDLRGRFWDCNTWVKLGRPSRSVAERLTHLRAELLVWKLTRRIDSTHSGNCKRPLLRIANAKARLERVRRMAATWQR